MQSLQHLSKQSTALKARGAPPAATRPPTAKNAWASIQRAPTCACGGSCPRCQSAVSGLKISEPNDSYEREADAVADIVMRMAGAESPVAPVEPVLQLKRATYEGQKGDGQKGTPKRGRIYFPQRLRHTDSAVSFQEEQAIAGGRVIGGCTPISLATPQRSVGNEG